MHAALQRSLQVLEPLAANPEAFSLSSLLRRLDMPLSATHRVLSDRCQAGHVRQASEPLSSIAAPIRQRDGHVLGVAPVADPTIRATRMQALAAALGPISRACTLWGKPQPGKA